jgi:hypothetical protein
MKAEETFKQSYIKAHASRPNVDLEDTRGKSDRLERYREFMASVDTEK